MDGHMVIHLTPPPPQKPPPKNQLSLQGVIIKHNQRLTFIMQPLMIIKSEFKQKNML